METHDVFDVFTPSKPARVSFIDREAINEKLVNSIKTPGKQIVVYGHSGSGKTTLLTNKLFQIYEDHITTRCMRGVTFEQVMLDAFDQLTPFYTEEFKKTVANTTKIDLGATYESIKLGLQLSSTQEISQNQKRALPPQLTPQALGRLMGATRLCWVIEDFHKVDGEEKQKLAQLMKVFMDLADECRHLKIVCLGAVDTARQVVDYDEEMKERVSEIHVPLMTDEEIHGIIQKGENALNIIFPLSIKKKVAKYACGVASVCHQLCLNMCLNAGIEKTESARINLTEDDFDKSVKSYISDASDSLKGAFDKALKMRGAAKFNSSELIVKALSLAPEKGLPRLTLLRRIQEENATYTDAILKRHIPKLLEEEYGAILRLDSDSGLYSFKDPFYRAYAQALLHANSKSNSSTNSFTSRTVQYTFQREIFLALKESFAKLDINIEDTLNLP